MLAVVFAVALLRVPAHAQMEESALSEAEVEKLRDTAYFPPQRVEAFIDFLNVRAEAIGKLTIGKRQPGREQDIHDEMEQFTSIASDLEDNLEEYGKTHKDIRKALPKVLSAAERWGTALKTPPENAEYSLQRKLALEALDDVRETAKELIEEQKAWFLAHPPAKAAGKGSGG